MRSHRQAFPTPRGATGGCPPDNVCGGRPGDPRESGKRDPKGGLARPPGGTRGVFPRLRYAGDAPAAPGVVAGRVWFPTHTARPAVEALGVNALKVPLQAP